MKEQDRILKSIALNAFKDTRIVKTIVHHPFMFVKKVMADPDDYRPIRIRFLGVFVMKYMKNKEMLRKYSYIVSAIKLHPEVIGIFENPTFDNEYQARIFINKAFVNNEKENILVIYDAIYKAIGEI
jgi:hypothetical protein